MAESLAFLSKVSPEVRAKISEAIVIHLSEGLEGDNRVAVRQSLLSAVDMYGLTGVNIMRMVSNLQANQRIKPGLYHALSSIDTVAKQVTIPKIEKEVKTMSPNSKPTAPVIPVGDKHPWRKGSMGFIFHELLMSTPMTLDEAIRAGKNLSTPMTEPAVRRNWGFYASKLGFQGYTLADKGNGKFQIVKK